MGTGRTRFAAVLIAVVLGIATVVVIFGRIHPGSRHAAPVSLKSMALHESPQELLGDDSDSGGTEAPAAEAYSDRANPADTISMGDVQRAIAAGRQVNGRGAQLSSKWDFLGPETLNVDRLGTQTFIKPTQWSGRVTAMAVSPNCKPQECTLYVGAAGGGLWRSTNALAPSPSWKHISDDIPTNAIGSVTVDPTDSTGKTIYVGTGEGNSSGDTEAGLGLYKTTDGGSHWSLVPGSFAAANNRSITWVAVDPANPSHILMSTRSGVRGIGSNSTSTNTLASVSPAVGVWVSRDGGATFANTVAGSVNEVKFDPLSANTVYAAEAGIGLIRSNAGGDAGSWQTIFSGNRSRYSFSAVAKDGKTRIYLSDASGSGQGAQVYRIDDASQPAATLTASSNAAWLRLSNSTDGTPGFTVYNYCNTPLVGSQCSYDMFTMSPADNPDMVVVGGLMHYEELKPYAAPGEMRGNGRAVLMSLDGGIHWTDVTGDVGGEAMHPDQHALAFVPGNPLQFFVGSDGGVIRTSGQYADASSQCDGRNLKSALYLSDCKSWLSKIPTQLTVMNAGLGTLQMNSIEANPFNPANDVLTGTQDNGTLAYTGSTTWELPLTGDGGDAGFDATDPKLRFHTYTNGQMDVNYNGDDQNSWLWIGDRFIVNFPESIRFYNPTIADPQVSKTIFVGAQRVWRTTDAGGDRSFLEHHCNTAVGEFPSDLLYTGACGSANDWSPLGSTLLTATSLGTKSGGNISAMSRAQDASTLWVATGNGRVFISRNANDPAASVTFTRIDSAAQPNRTPSSIYVDPTNANHAIVTFSGYEANTPTAPGHVFDVVFDPSSGTATWSNISYDLGDQPIDDAVLDVATGDLYVSTDFGVDRLVSGTQTWVPAADGLPTVTVSGLTLADGHNGDRLLYAATHGRGAYRLRLK
jgi:hypothetical protein